MVENRAAREPLRLRTNAKINLFLEVKGRRSDGYHEIETVFHSVSLADTLEVTPRADGGIALAMEAEEVEGRDLPGPEDNLVVRALRGYARRTDRAVDLEVRIAKRIPLAAGLGGGSANAAGALLAANELYAGALDTDSLSELAAEVGSDVAFCLSGGTALGSGRGERIEPLSGPRLHLVLGLARERLETRAVYARVRTGTGNGPGVRDLVAALAAGDVSALAALLRNDLEPAAMELLPELAERKEALLAAGALGALVCGSGPSLFAVARDEAHALQVAASVRDSFHRVEVVSSRPSGVENSVLP